MTMKPFAPCTDSLAPWLKKATLKLRKPLCVAAKSASKFPGAGVRTVTPARPAGRKHLAIRRRPDG